MNAPHYFNIDPAQTLPEYPEWNVLETQDQVHPEIDSHEREGQQGEDAGGAGGGPERLHAPHSSTAARKPWVSP
ncbi:MAG: hypothetical protein EXR43_00225 [Dehalococcoidia bacterium]|nr:hypothetical protein [Dehalococcoidia bacterium]